MEETLVMSIIKATAKRAYGLISFVLMWGLLFCFSIWCLALTLLRLLAIIPTVKKHVHTLIFQSYRLLFSCCRLLLSPHTSVNIHCLSSKMTLDRNRNYLLVCNHQSWSDTLILLSFFQPYTSNIKLIMKKSLLWQLPLASWFCYFNGFPMINRKRSSKNKDANKKAIQNACENIKSLPSTLIIFPEGTRYSETKRNQYNSPYKHLLPPKSGALKQCVKGLDNSLAGIIDVTLTYQPKQSIAKNLMYGQLKNINILYRFTPLDEINQYGKTTDDASKSTLERWLEHTWLEKNQLIKDIYS